MNNADAASRSSTRALCKRNEPRLKPVAKDEPTGVQDIETYSAGFALEKRGKIGHIDAGQAAVEQLADRKRLAPIVHGHHDLIHFVTPAQLKQHLARVHLALGWQSEFLARRLHEAHEHETALVRTAPQTGDRLRTLAGTVNEYAALEGCRVHQARKSQPEEQH